MNERIQELSDIAYKNHLRNNPESSFGRRTDYDTKFAELIVKECAEVLLKWKGEPFPFDEDLAVRLIKENFGVER